MNFEDNFAFIVYSAVMVNTTSAMLHFEHTSYIYHHHHVVPLARISQTLSRHFSLSFIASGRSSGLHLVSSHSCSMYVRAGLPAFARPYKGVHRSTSLMSSSLLLQNIYIYIYIYIYIPLRKITGHIRIINSFPSCYGYWYESIYLPVKFKCS